MVLLVVGCATDEGPDETLGPLPTGETTDFVEVSRYIGTWYEIASIPMGFQASCYATTATYGIIDAQTVSVLNRCNFGKLDGSPLQIEGTATVVDLVTNAQLEVDFGFAQAPYWIVDLGTADGATPYPWAVVSNPARDALWLLARTPRISEARFDAIIDRLEQRAFDPARMLRTTQP
jgi:apolipoprotein D and lipocalin family protein